MFMSAYLIKLKKKKFKNRLGKKIPTWEMWFPPQQRLLGPNIKVVTNNRHKQEGMEIFYVYGIFYLAGILLIWLLPTAGYNIYNLLQWKGS